MIVTIGASLPLSGPYRKSGEASLQLLQRAAAEVNPYAQADLLVEDGAGDAVQAVRSLASRGARVTIGGEDSSQLAAVIPILSQLNLVHVNFISTVPSLAAADNSFRMLSDDRYEGAFMAELMSREGIRTVVPLWRGDDFGDELKGAMARRFTELGGTVAPGVRYNPEGFSAAVVLASAASQLSACWRGPGALPAAVYLAAFDEVVPLFRQADIMPELPLVKWYGSNGTAQSDALAADLQAARYAVRVSFPNPAPGLPGTALPKWGELLSGGITVFNVLAYDAFWLAAQSLLIGGDLKTALAGRARFYFGASGPCSFNAAGDRESTAFDLYSVHETGFRWSMA